MICNLGLLLFDYGEFGVLSPPKEIIMWKDLEEPSNREFHQFADSFRDKKGIVKLTVNKVQRTFAIDDVDIYKTF